MDAAAAARDGGDSRSDGACLAGFKARNEMGARAAVEVWACQCCVIWRSSSGALPYYLRNQPPTAHSGKLGPVFGVARVVLAQANPD